MRTTIAAGAIAGLAAGVVLDAVMRIMRLGQGAESMIGYGAGLVHTTHLTIGWFVYPVYGVLLGLAFGWVLQARSLDIGRATALGLAWGLAWWLIAAVILVPAGLGDWPLSPAAVDAVRRVALPLLIGHLVYGAILGVCWSELRFWLTTHPHRGTPATDRRAA
ncbi:MAG TPA: hypothetical protein VHT71_20820 [Methylomirabilota bacterium]|jgi:hypothetical protein|nr:hypothetical protein [Methylomirabilota bacterium]